VNNPSAKDREASKEAHVHQTKQTEMFTTIEGSRHPRLVRQTVALSSAIKGSVRKRTVLQTQKALLSLSRRGRIPCVVIAQGYAQPALGLSNLSL